MDQILNWFFEHIYWFVIPVGYYLIMIITTFITGKMDLYKNASDDVGRVATILFWPGAIALFLIICIFMLILLPFLRILDLEDAKGKVK